MVRLQDAMLLLPPVSRGSGRPKPNGAERRRQCFPFQNLQPEALSSSARRGFSSGEDGLTDSWSWACAAGLSHLMHNCRFVGCFFSFSLQLLVAT